MILPVSFTLDNNFNLDEVNESIEWYRTMCKHGEPCTIEQHAEIAAQQFIANVIGMHRNLKGAKEHGRKD